MTVCERRREVRVREEVYEVPCGSRYCAACGTRWQGDQRVCAVAAAGELTGDVALLTVTAPGRAWLAREAAAARVTVREVMRRWNETARRRWRALHLAASRPLRRWARARGLDWRLLMRAWEYQKRGALHLHLVVPYGTPDEVRFTRLYLYNLWSCAADEGFGFVLSGGSESHAPIDAPHPITPAKGASAARYVAKYVASTGAGKEGMHGVAKHTAMRGSVLYIARVLGERSGVTMTTLRARRRIATKYPGANESQRAWDAACLVDSVAAGRAPLTPEAVSTLREAASVPGVVAWVDPSDGCPEAPTRAARPLGADEDRAPYAGPTRVLVVELASVLLRDPDPGPLGPTRTSVVRVEVLAVR